jgi:hypothetical protein
MDRPRTTGSVETLSEDHPISSGDTEQAIEELAAHWLETERAATDRANTGGSEERARAASEAYERSVRSASSEELLIAWHAALGVQYACEIGSASWAEARAVSELLRVEYLAHVGE